MSRSKLSVPSPCVDVCIFDPATSWCIGCGRTRAECRQWRSAPRKELRALQAQLVKRMRTLQTSQLWTQP
ncbi:DUF1289 domain-containing protein [Erythrobacter sp. QSSC1-22B]|uniref:DUF1289 domain-containing protein n=1 Tax=Erythrobacter sp. QSSC1-22B TaxID=1860125 RepID=UPI0009F5896C|nr:DUF1289 domain-containing protein [Erythrobacter sp. QSSC1-22B]